MSCSRRRSCCNDPDSFCYICGEYILKEYKRSITDFVRKVYRAYFGVKLGDQDKPWAPHVVCKSCVEHLRMWTKGKTKSFRFGVPMVWREQKNHFDDCYFCMVDLKGFNRHKKKSWIYPDLESARRPVPHCEYIPVSQFSHLPEKPSEWDFVHQASESCSESDVSSIFEESSTSPKQFNQEKLSDLIRDLNLSKEASEVLASRLKDKKCLSVGTKVTFYRTRESDLLPYYRSEEGLVFCSDVEGLLLKMGIPEYKPQDWRLFIDSSKRSLKCVLLHNGNKYASIPIGHSTLLKEKYNNIKQVLEKLNYCDHQWLICVDLKMVNFLLGQQSGYTKYPCFICLWDSRARSDHWVKKEWPERITLTVNECNVINEPLVPREKIILPPLHIKLGIMKQFVKALPVHGNCFNYICRVFPGMSNKKLKAGIFDGPQIRKLMNDPNFTASMTEKEFAAWISFTVVVKNFLGNNKVANNYIQIVEDMLSKFQSLGAKMSIKIHYLFSHLDRFPENLGELSEEQGERFHQDIKVMEERYQGRWDTHMMADYCWNLQQHKPFAPHARKSYKRRLVS